MLAIDTVIPGLYASTPQQLPFAPSLEIRAFVLEREQGNLLIYGAGTLADDAAAIDDLGGISRQYLNHWHESMFGCAAVGAPLLCHDADRETVARKCHVAAGFSKRHMLADDFEVIPIPGHTPGATAFLWDSGRHRLLFTGDSLYLDDDEWVVALDVSGSDRARYIESLELIREMEFDVLVPWAATAGGPHHTVVERREAQARLDAVLDRVRDGASR